jgi:hypothetical protein
MIKKRKPLLNLRKTKKQNTDMHVAVVRNLRGGKSKEKQERKKQKPRTPAKKEKKKGGREKKKKSQTSNKKCLIFLSM